MEESKIRQLESRFAYCPCNLQIDSTALYHLGEGHWRSSLPLSDFKRQHFNSIRAEESSLDRLEQSRSAGCSEKRLVNYAVLQSHSETILDFLLLLEYLETFQKCLIEVS